MDCAVENAMIKHQEKLVNQETSLQLFVDSIDDELAGIMEIVKTLKKKARDYDVANDNGIENLIGHCYNCNKALKHERLAAIKDIN